MFSKHVNPGSWEEHEILDQTDRNCKDIQTVLYDNVKYKINMWESMRAQDLMMQNITKMYCCSMFLMCCSPRNKGVGTNAILNMLGMWTSCYLMSKTFRSDNDLIIPQELTAEMHYKMFDEPSQSVLSKRIVLTENADGNHRLLMSPESIAMMRVSICEQAYKEMRLPDVDVQNIGITYRQRDDELLSLAAEDGISTDIVNQECRKLIANLIEHKPEKIQCFEELAYGDNVKAAPHRKSAEDAMGHIHFYNAWNGEFMHRSGDIFTDNIHPRYPLTMEELSDNQEEEWDNLMKYCNTPEAWFKQMQLHGLELSERYRIMTMSDTGMSAAEYACRNKIMQKKIDGLDMFHNGTAGADMFLTNPEFMRAFNRWLGDHPKYSPADWQRQAKQLAQDGPGNELQEVWESRIDECLHTSDQLLSQWKYIFEHMSDMSVKMPIHQVNDYVVSKPSEKMCDFSY